MDLNLAKIKARNVFEKTYTDTATIKVFEKVVVNGLTKTILSDLYENIPCKICYFNYSASPIEQTVYGTNESKIVLMISPDIKIPSNSKIIVTSNEKKCQYINSKSVIFVTHQAVFLREEDTKS